jgi:hypothetical protein
MVVYQTQSCINTFKADVKSMLMLDNGATIPNDLLDGTNRRRSIKCYTMYECVEATGFSCVNLACSDIRANDFTSLTRALAKNPIQGISYLSGDRHSRVMNNEDDKTVVAPAQPHYHA